jgi:hypothetical protein
VPNCTAQAFASKGDLAKHVNNTHLPDANENVAGTRITETQAADAGIKVCPHCSHAWASFPKKHPQICPKRPVGRGGAGALPRALKPQAAMSVSAAQRTADADCYGKLARKSERSLRRLCISQGITIHDHPGKGDCLMLAMLASREFCNNDFSSKDKASERTEDVAAARELTSAAFSEIAEVGLAYHERVIRLRAGRDGDGALDNDAISTSDVGGPNGADMAHALLLDLARDSDVRARMAYAENDYTHGAQGAAVATLFAPSPNAEPSSSDLRSFTEAYARFLATPRSWLGKADLPAVSL